MIVGLIYIALIISLVWSIVYGRRLIRNERTDAVFGNPVRALGGWHWVVCGISSILLIWYTFSWGCRTRLLSGRRERTVPGCKTEPGTESPAFGLSAG